MVSQYEQKKTARLIRELRKRDEEHFIKISNFTIEGKPASYEEWFFETGLDYEIFVGVPDISFTKTFWKWFKTLMVEIYGQIADGRFTEKSLKHPDFFKREFEMFPMPPMVYDKIINEFVKTPKFKQIQAKEDNPNRSTEKPLKSKLKTF